MAFNWEPSAKPRMEMARPRVPRCKSCGSTNIEDDPTSGDRACQNCGVVQQENGIVSTVQFSESGGSSNVVGQFVSGDKGRPSGGGAGRGRGRFGHSRDSRETTIQNGKKKIIQVLAQLHLKTTLAEAAGRLFALCVQQNYVQGRKTMNIVAACVYIVCRQKHFPIMLIDISDKLAVNVYVLGKTFQKLIKHLNLQHAVPIVDPAMYIKRFAAKLDLGSKTNAVCMTALKIIGSMKRDFLASGRQPAGVCCAALTLATRVNRIERSKEEIRKAVKVCDATVRKRLLEFEATPTSQLTVEELNKLPQTVAFPGVEEAAEAPRVPVGFGGDAADGSGQPAPGAAGSAVGGAAAAGEVSVLVSDVRMDPPAFIANRIRDGRLKMPWTEPTPPESREASVERRKGARGAKKAAGGGRAAAKAGSVRPRGTRKHGTKDGRGGGSGGASAKKMSPPKRRGGGRGEGGGSSSGGDDDEEEEEEEEEEEAGSRRVLPKRKAAAAAASRASKAKAMAVSSEDTETDDGDDDGEDEAEGGSGDEDDDSEYSSGEEKDSDDDGSEYGRAVARGRRGGGGSNRKAKAKGKGKGRAAAAVASRGRKRKKSRDYSTDEEEEEEAESEDGEEEDDYDDDDEGEDAEGEQGEGVRLSSKMKVDANTEEGREALTRHVLQVSIRSSQSVSSKAKSRAKRSKVESDVYSCLESMFDEDEARGLGVDPTGGGGGGGNINNNTNDDGDSSNSGKRVAAAAVEQDKDKGKGRANGRGKDRVGASTPAASGSNKTKTGSRVPAAEDNEGGSGGGGDDDADDVEWGVYLRTEEDSDRTKKEWEKEHQDWEDEQESKLKILAEAPKKKRNYTTRNKTDDGDKTFQDRVLEEADRSKSLKIDHAALQRVMNVDGSLKHVDEDDDVMEEVFEDNLAPPPAPASSSSSSKKGKGNGGRGKSPLTASLSASASSSSSTAPAVIRPFAGSAVLPPARRGNNTAGTGSGAGTAARGGGAAAAAEPARRGGPKSHGGRGGGKGQRAAAGQAGPQPAAVAVAKAPVVKAPWARAGPDDGGEKAIKDALALLAMGGGLAAAAAAAPAAAPAPAVLPGFSDVRSAASARAGAGAAATVPTDRGSSAAAPSTAVPDVAETVEEMEGVEEEEDGEAVEGAATAATAAAAVEEEEEDDEDEDDEDALYGEVDDFDDPYGEEA